MRTNVTSESEIYYTGKEWEWSIVLSVWNDYVYGNTIISFIGKYVERYIIWSSLRAWNEKAQFLGRYSKTKRQMVAKLMMEMVKTTHRISEWSLHRFMAKQSHCTPAVLCLIYSPSLSVSITLLLRLRGHHSVCLTMWIGLWGSRISTWLCIIITAFRCIQTQSFPLWSSIQIDRMWSLL